MNNKAETMDTIESLQLQIKKLNDTISLQEKRIASAEMAASTHDKIMDTLKNERSEQENNIKQAYDEIAEKSELIRIMLENAPVGLTIFDENFKFIDCNEAVLQMYDVTREFYSSFFGSASHSPAIQPDGSNSYDKAMEVIKRVMNGEKMKIDWMHCLPDGTPLPVELTMMRIKQGDKYIGLGYIYDMRKQKQLIQELINTQKAHENKLLILNSVVKATKIGLWDVDMVANDLFNPKNTFIWSNEFRNMLGYSNEIDFPNTFDSWKNNLHPDDEEKAISEVVKYILEANGNISYDSEYRMRKKDGEYLYFRAYGEAIRDSEGYIIHFAGAFIDITETKNTIIKNEMQLTKLNVLIRATKNGLWDTEIINHDSANPEFIFNWSDDFRNMLGYTDIIDFPNTENSWSDRIHPDDKDRVYDCFDRHLQDKTGNTPYDIEYRMYRKNGDCVYFRDTCAALRDKDGNPVRIIGTVVDITEAKNLEQKLIKAARFSESIIESMPIGMFTFNGNPPRIVTCNDKLARMFNAPKEYVIKNYFNDFMPEYLPDGRTSLDLAKSMINRAMAGEVIKSDWLYNTADGTPLTCDLTLTQVNDEEEFMGLGFLYDITEIRKREQELIHAHEMNKLQLTKINLINKAARIGLWDMEIIRDDPMNIQNTIIYYDEFREILGYTDENDFPNVLSSFSNCLHPDDYQMVTDKLNNHIADPTGRTPFDPEYMAKKKNGEYIYVRATGQSIRDGYGNAIRTLGTIMDVSEDKNTLFRIEKLRDEAETANRAKSDFLSNM
ncbi:MAG: PAS domain-containing protein, partial [Oscillospiraceae bacterium]|nr:PAS domain-containing protein [Oscillospiraceae bacterium]